jgi:hypothetical protein
VAAIDSPDTTTGTTSGSPMVMAWIVTLVIAAGLVIVVMTAAFSQNNTPASIDGTTATTSQFID